jgi:hypothetical protein
MRNAAKMSETYTERFANGGKLATSVEKYKIMDSALNRLTLT